MCVCVRERERERERESLSQRSDVCVCITCVSVCLYRSVCQTLNPKPYTLNPKLNLAGHRAADRAGHILHQYLLVFGPFFFLGYTRTNFRFEFQVFMRILRQKIKFEFLVPTNAQPTRADACPDSLDSVKS